MIFLRFSFLLETGDLQARDGANWENSQVTASLPHRPVSLKFLNILLKDNLPHSQNACQHSRPDLLQQIMNDRADHFPSGKNHALFGYFFGCKK